MLLRKCWNINLCFGEFIVRWEDICVQAIGCTGFLGDSLDIEQLKDGFWRIIEMVVSRPKIYWQILQVLFLSPLPEVQSWSSVSKEQENGEAHLLHDFCFVDVFLSTDLYVLNRLTDSFEEQKARHSYTHGRYGSHRPISIFFHFTTVNGKCFHIATPNGRKPFEF